MEFTLEFLMRPLYGISNNNLPLAKPKEEGCCFFICTKKTQSPENIPTITSGFNTSTEAYTDFRPCSSGILISDMPGYKDLFMENSDSSRYTLSRISSRKVSQKSSRAKSNKIRSISIQKLKLSTSEKKKAEQIIIEEKAIHEKVKEKDIKTVKDSDKSSRVDFEEITIDWMKRNLQLTDYACHTFIGEGTFGKVFSCIDSKGENKSVAIKVGKKLEKYRKLAMHEISLLNRVKKYDPNGRNFVIILKDWFDLDGHILLVFPEYGENLYRFLKFNNHIGIPLEDVRHISVQLWTAVRFLHSLTIIHTDIKPENLLLVFKDYQYPIFEYSLTGLKVLSNADIVLIDLGNAISNKDSKPKLIVTRYYRAPEVYLGLEWDQSVDIWSIGCVMFELYTGRSLFQCRADTEHLWMMQYALKKFPDRMINKSKLRNVFFNQEGYVLTENIDVNKLKMRLQGFETFIKNVKEEVEPLTEVIMNCLKYNPKERITTQDALYTRFLS